VEGTHAGGMETRPQTAHPSRVRRPTGTPPPLPRDIGLGRLLWVALALVIVGGAVALVHFVPAALDRIDAVITDAITSLRVGWLDSFARPLNSVVTRAGPALIGLATVVVAVWNRQWRRLIVFLIVLFVLERLVALLAIYAARPRPFDIEARGSWEGFSLPSAPIAVCVGVLAGAAYTLSARGRPRSRALALVAILVAGAGLLRVYLGIDHPTDVVLGAILGAALVSAIFRAAAPDDAFPVRYGRTGKAAHLDVGGRRGAAIRRAVEEQLGLTVRSIEPVGLEGSGGSTPLRMEVVDEGGSVRAVFAKLYAKSHVRSDRWYKLGRSMLYGGLEDETPFTTVRRFVEYEDYTLRLLGDLGFPTPAPLGVVEITPEREYLIAMEFFDGAVEIGEASVDEQVIDEGLRLVRRMWDQGLAHRDLKPANLMVQDGHLRLIDVFFVQVRPSPWRQAVDLGNMMLVLALRSDAPTVDRIARRYFSPDDLAEAFAATRGVASPTQLRRSMRKDGRHLLQEFRGMAPSRPPIRIQRWSFRRVALIVAAVTVVSIAAATGVGLFFPSRGAVLRPACGTGRTMQLMGQSVPSSTRLPCVRSLPVGWVVGGTRIVRGSATFELELDLGLAQPPSEGATTLEPVIVTLAPVCPSGALDPALEILRVEGGCVTYLPPGTANDEVIPSFEEGGGLDFVERSELVAEVEDRVGMTLCGADAPPCEG
jgi:membrane-associated phospholipid phosphatase/tRNA A-37 threonylcarbamoyl transferase component Bud32